MNVKSFGLDIGTKTIKAVALSYGGGGFLLSSNLLASTPPKGILSESFLDEQEMARAIKTVVNSAKITTKDVNIALAENQVYTKTIEMPLLSDKELAYAVYWEAEQYIPVPLSNITLAWSVLKVPNQSQKIANEKTQVLIIGAETLLIKKYQKILSMAGLNVVSVETEILSVIRALFYNTGKETSFPSTLVIHVGANSASLAIVRNGVLVFIYSMPVGGVAINRAIEADFGLSEAQSEEYKRAYGIVKEGQGDKIGKAIEPILNSILSEVKKALSFYSEKYKEDAIIRQILLSGGTAKLPGIDAFFAENTGIETVVANPWKILAQKELKDELLKNASDYTVAVGLAMKSYV